MEVKVVTVREEPSRTRRRDNSLESPEEIRDLWRTVIARSPWFHQDKEHLVSLCLDAQHRLKSFSLVSMGTLNETLAHPREIFRPAIADSARSIIVVHNHPSGDPSPSRLDLRLTRQLYLVGDLLRIPLLDHIIIGDGKYFSFREVARLWPENQRDAFRLEKMLGREFRAAKRKRRATSPNGKTASKKSAVPSDKSTNSRQLKGIV